MSPADAHARCPRPSARSLLLVITLALAGCGGEDDARAVEPSPVVLLGVDGFEWDVLLPLLRAGRLPTLAGIMERGVCGELETTRPTSSPILWTTVATGKGAEEHGIGGFVKAGDEGGVQLYDRTDRRTKALWNIASDYRRRVACVGWWMTFPVEEIAGVMVAQTNTAAQADARSGKNVWKGQLIEGVAGQVHPPEREPEVMALRAEVEAELPRTLEQVFGERRRERSVLGQRLWENCIWAFRADSTYLRVAERLLTEPPAPALTMLYLGGPDVVGHRFWRYMEPDRFEHVPEPEEVEAFGTVIQDYYVQVDRALARLMEAADPATTWILVSDHGMHAVGRKKRFDPESPPADVNSGHHQDAPPGVLFAIGPGVRSAPLRAPALERDELTVIGSIFDVAPTVLALLDIPAGRDMPGRPLAAVLRASPDDWPAPIETHDTPEFVAGLAGEAVNPGEEERLNQLRSLGYVDDEED